MVLDPIRCYCWLRLLQSLAVSATGAYFSLYQVKVAGLDPLALVLVGTALEAAIFLFEVPTGAVADAFGRKASFCVGFILAGLAFVFMGSNPVFWALVAGSLVWGFGETLISGARDAWVVDEIPHSSQTEMGADQVFLTGHQWSLAGQLMGIIGAACLVLLGSYQLSILTGGLAWSALGLAAWIFLPEKGFTRPSRRTDGAREALKNFREGWSQARANRGILIFLLVTACFGLSSEGFDRLWQKHLNDAFTIPSFFGLSSDLWWAAVPAASLVAAWGLVALFQRSMPEWDEAKARRTLAVMTLAQVGVIALCAWAGSLWLALGAAWAVRTFRKANTPLLTAWLNSLARPEIRATVLSLEGQADSVGQITGGPIAGVAASLASDARWGMTASSILLAPAVALMARKKR